MNSTILGPVLGGLFIGLGVSALMLSLGKIAGISGILGGLLAPARGDWTWRIAFVLGVVVVGAAWFALQPARFQIAIPHSSWAIAAAGLLVGFGSRIGSGCTSGHGVCGIARLGPRSIVATLVFMTSGALTTWVVRSFFGGAL